jgi:hypothetical protein
MLLSVVITIQLLEESYTLHLVLDIDLGLDHIPSQDDIDDGDLDFHLEYSFDYSDEEISINYSSDENASINYSSDEENFHDYDWFASQNIQDSRDSQDSG